MTHTPHNLAIDIGNSGLRLSLLDVERQSVGEPLRISWSYNSNSNQDAADHDLLDRCLPDSEDWFPALQRWLDQHTGTAAATWLISSVRRDATARLSKFIAGRPHDVPRVIGFRDVPLDVQVDYPAQLGIDRLLAAYAAAATVNTRPLIVIQAGSAVTIDLLVASDSGRDAFAGGAILPGIPMMLRLLGRGADMLPEIEADELIELPPLPGKNTKAAMLCGASAVWSAECSIWSAVIAKPTELTRRS